METITSPTDTQNSTSNLLFCRACQAVYQQPKLLPCLHSFCRPCLVHAVTNRSEGTFIVCPVCSHKSQLPASGVVGVPDNQFLNRLCQEYLTEIQNHLVSRSLNHLNPQRSSELSISSTDVGSSTSGQKYSSLSSFRSQTRTPEFSQSVEDDEEATNQSPTSGQSFGQRPPAGQSTEITLEAIRNMNKLQTKLMSLQGEALRVTYAIDEVNQSLVDWYQHKEDLKKAVERRTTQFQFYIKRMEHKLIAQIDSKQTDDLFYTESDKAKAELRKILNNILHEVNVLKTVQEFGKDAEINSLSAILLGSSVGMAEVSLKKLHFDLEVPSATIEDIVGDNFGVIRFNSAESKVFVPEVSELGDVSVENITQTLSGSGNITRNVEKKETVVKEKEESENAPTGRTLARRSADRRSRRHNTDLGLDKPDVKEYLAQLQNARENLSAKRKEILERGRQASEDALPFRDEIHRRPRSISRTGRGQSLDRVGLPASSNRRATLPSGLTLHEVKSLNMTEPEALSPTLQEEVSHSPKEPSDKFQRELEGDLSIPQVAQGDLSSVRKELPFSTSHQKILVKQTSDPRYIRELPTSPTEAPGSEILYPSHSQSLIEQLRNRRFSNPSNILLERRISDQVNSLPPGESEDLVQYDRATARPVRRAISSVADRKAKIDFLRENWQKRKEILIQNEGFVSPETAKQMVKPPSHVQLTEEEDDSKVLISETVEVKTQDHPSPPPADPKFESMHAIRSRVAQYRSELTKKNDTTEDEVKAKTPDSPSTHISNHFRFDLDRQKYNTSQTQASPVLKSPGTISPTTGQTEPSVTEIISPPIHLGSHNLTNQKSPQIQAHQLLSQITTNQTASEVPTSQRESHLYTNQTKSNRFTNETSSSQRFTSETPPVSSYKTLISTNDIDSQINTNHNVPLSTQASTNIQEKPSVSAFPVQTTITTTAAATPLTSTPMTTTTTTTSSYSRYSRYQSKKVEPIDIASLIAAMYSGNEKKIIHIEEQSPDTTSSIQSTTTQAASVTTGNTLPTETSTGSAHTPSPATSLPDTSSRYASRYQTESRSQLTTEKNKNHNQQNVFNISNETIQPEPESLTKPYRYTGLYSRYNNQATSNISTTAGSTTTAVSSATSTYMPADSLHSRSSVTSTLRPSESIHTKSSAEISANESPSASYRSQQVALKDPTSPTQASPVNIVEKSEESMQEDPPQWNRYGVYSRYSTLRNSHTTTASSVTAPTMVAPTSIVTDPSTAAENTSSHSSSSMGGANLTTSKYQMANVQETTTIEQVTSAKSAHQSEEPTKESQLKPTRRTRSRFTDGVNRRHTIEIGKEAIQSALKLYSKDETEPVCQTILDPISESPVTTTTPTYTPYPIPESPVTTHTPTYTPYHSRLLDKPSKMGESTNGSSPTLLSSAEPLEASEIKDTIISYKIKASGVTTKIIPTSLEVIQERSPYDQSQTLKTTPDIPPAPATPPSPSLLSLSPDEIAQKIKLREIARKKKERWRHMTIH